MGRVLTAVRLDGDVYNAISELAELTDMSRSEVIRFLLYFSLSVLAPGVRLRDLIRENYLARLERGDLRILDMDVIDVLRVPTQAISELFTLLTRFNDYQPNAKTKSRA